MIKDYKVISMDYDGETLQEYYTYIVPAVNDTVILDDYKSFIVQARYFSINHLKVILLGELDKVEEGKIENDTIH